MKLTFAFLLLFLGCGTIFGQQSWTLNDCMRYAVENNPDTKRQELLLEDAKNTQLESAMRLLPSISGGTSVGVSFGRSIDPETNVYDNVSYMNQNYNVSGSVYLFNGLQGINNIRIAKFSRIKQESDAKRVDDLISLETMKAFFQLVFNEGAFQIAKEKLSQSSELLRKCEEEHKLGIKSIADLSQAQSAVASDEYKVISSEGALEKSMIMLKNKMYYPLRDTLDVNTHSSFDASQHFQTIDPEEVFLKAIEFLPEIKMFEMDLRNSKLKLNSVRGSYYPRLSLNGGYNTGYSKNLSDAALPSQTYIEQLRNKSGENVGVSFNVPIFNGLTTRVAVRKAKNDYNRSQIAFDEKMREIESTIREAVLDVETARKEFTQAEKGVAASQISYNIASMKYTEGLASIIDLQTIQNQFSEAKISRLNAILSYLIKLKVVKYYQGEPYIN